MGKKLATNSRKTRTLEKISTFKKTPDNFVSNSG